MSRPSTGLVLRVGQRHVLWLAMLSAIVALAPPTAHATHERAALITWAPTTGNAVEFTITGAWRRSAYSTANGRCRNPNDTTAPVLGSIPCTGAGGFAGPGDVIVELQGGTQFNPGEGSNIGSPLGPLLYVVTSVDPVNDWLYATAIDPNSLPTVDTTINKTYSSSATRVAFIADCCRVSNNPGGNQHINNPDGNYRIETTVTPGGSNRPPVSTMPPIVLCPKNGICAFTVPSADPDGDTVTYRMSTSTEASGSSGGFDQPGPPNAPNAASINSASGVYTWNTSGAQVGGATSNTYYSTQVTVEDRDAMNNVKSKIAVDFLIQLVDQGAGVPPVFDHPPTPACGSTINVGPGDTASFTVQASDSDFGQTVTLNAVGLPSGATLTPALPTTANPVSSAFSWTTGGGDSGTTHVITFTATDTALQQAQCTITVAVSQCQNNADCDDGSACTTDVCDPMHPDANGGGCVISTVECDACQVCDADLGCTGPVCTPTQTVTATATPTATDTGTPLPTSTPTNTPEPFCGDGNVDPGETCDDGNMFPTDGCEPDCTVSTACSLSYPGIERFVGGCDMPNHADIQAAVNAAADGDVISVCPGTYTQSVVVTKQVKIRANAGGPVTVHTNGTAFDIRRSGVQIEGLNIQSDTGAAVTATTLCPLGQTSCASPGEGTNLTLANNTIHDSPVGIGWQRRIGCVQITGNTMTGNAVHIELHQQEGAPATLVSIVDNDISTGGQAGAAVSLSGLGVTVAANTIATSSNAGIRLADMAGGGATQVIENNIADNNGDGITVQPGAEGTEIHENNITDNEVGLSNESTTGTLDATLNWWDSQSGPSGVFTGNGDTIVNGSGATTQFIEYLCKPFPVGFPSIMGVCSTETPELVQLMKGRAPDLAPHADFVGFESDRNLHTDPLVAASNADGSQEIFLLNRKPSKKLDGVCLGGLQPCDFDNAGACETCNSSSECLGNPSADPIVLNGECVIVTQISDGTPGQVSSRPRLGTRGKHIAFASNNNQTGGNGDGSLEIETWSRKALKEGVPPVAMMTDGTAAQSSDMPEPTFSNRWVFLESNADPTGENADGNTEIFAYRTRRQQWVQVTKTLPPVENHRPATIRGKRMVFDSNGNLDPAVDNSDGNRELFVARVRPSGIAIAQVTDTLAPVENRSGSIDLRNSTVAFSSNGDFVGQNADGNREIFVWTVRSGAFEQITQSVGGDNANPCMNQNKRYVVFESTADLTGSGATNRRIFEFDRTKQELTLLSRSRFGTNAGPRSRRQFVVWESTSNLTGHNPAGERMIYLFDRKKD
jgi:cysteine-rich repeat protein/parallel beta-helix repeat protein